VFVDGLSMMHTVGGVTHLIFTVEQPETLASELRTERLVQARLIVPTDQLKAIARALLSGQVDTPYVGTAGEPVGLH
jgi:hypothetical protein